MSNTPAPRPSAAKEEGSDAIPLPKRVDLERNRHFAMGFSVARDTTHDDAQWDSLMEPYAYRLEEAATGDAVMDREVFEYTLVALMSLAAARAEAKIAKMLGIRGE